MCNIQLCIRLWGGQYISTYVGKVWCMYSNLDRPSRQGKYAGPAKLPAIGLRLLALRVLGVCCGTWRQAKCVDDNVSILD